MSYILSIETATKNCSVGLSLNGVTVLCREISENGYSHAEKLHVFIAEILKETQIGFSDLKAVAVSQGPGSYTGLRIGVSTAKGLCYSLGIPLIAIDTLESLAKQLQLESGVVVPMIDARRMECYTAIFDKKHTLKRAIESEIITENTYSDISDAIHLIGDGAPKCKSVLTDAKFVFHDDIVYPSANEMGSIAFEKYKKNDTVDVAYFEPFYLKDFILNR
ncbi:tRNA (adenosine(37)-N6)-threonylcarbamoyltransferase complex dimerization subunit type 1 TsaB [Flavobacterium sp. GCM10027622]|uniref:tRNA (adenosine(37)-N6)-threonylcarbamoyltransferase complex dimerization subunit type 1 TsaB n=1 Tax=unclassified Flavobacterium TaxID=196869 RepID=UPI003620C064